MPINLSYGLASSNTSTWSSLGSGVWLYTQMRKLLHAHFRFPLFCMCCSTCIYYNPFHFCALCLTQTKEQQRRGEGCLGTRLATHSTVLHNYAAACLINIAWCIPHRTMLLSIVEPPQWIHTNTLGTIDVRLGRGGGGEVSIRLHWGSQLLYLV